MYELDYENGEKRIEFMTRTPWLKNKTTGQIEQSAEGYPIGDNARDPRWKGYPMSLHFNKAVINTLPILTGPTEFYISNGKYAQYVPTSIFDDPNALTYAKLLRERYKEYLRKLHKEDNAARVKMLKEVETTKREMIKELKREYTKLKQLGILSKREEAAKKRRSRAEARGNQVAPNDGSIKEAYDSKLAEITIIEEKLNKVLTLIKQLKPNIDTKL